MMVIDNVYEIGQMVYLKTDIEQHERIVTGLLLRNIGVIYYLSLGENETSHYDFEISLEKDVVKSI